MNETSKKQDEESLELNPKLKEQIEEALEMTLSMGDEMLIKNLYEMMGHPIWSSFCRVLKSMKKANHIPTSTSVERDLISVISLLYSRCIRK